MIGLRDELDKSDTPMLLLPQSPTSPESVESPVSPPAPNDVEAASPFRFSPEEQPLTAAAAPEVVYDYEYFTPWWCSGLACCGLILLLSLILTSLLLYYGRAHLSAAQVAALEERMEEMEDDNTTLSAAHVDTLLGHVIDVPRRCEDGYRFFRGRCRRMF